MTIETPRDAELSAASFMRHHLGYSDAHATAATNDGGIDVTSSQAVAQVKLHMKPTGRPDLQRLFGANAHGGREMLFFSFRGYSPKAVAYGNSVGMALFQFNYAEEYFAVNDHAARIVRRKTESDEQAERNRRADQMCQEQAAAQRAREEEQRQRERAAKRAETQRRKDAARKQRESARAQAKQQRRSRWARRWESCESTLARFESHERQRRRAIGRYLPQILYGTIAITAALAAMFFGLVIIASLTIGEMGPKVLGVIVGVLAGAAMVFLMGWAYRRAEVATLRRRAIASPGPDVIVITRCPGCRVQNRAPIGASRSRRRDRPAAAGSIRPNCAAFVRQWRVLPSPPRPS